MTGTFSLFMLVCLVVVALLFTYDFIFGWQVRTKNWRLLVTRTGVSRERDSFLFERYAGHYRGRTLRFEISKWRRRTYTQAYLSVTNPEDLSLVINEDGLYRQGESFGARTFRSGDDIFDRRFSVKTHSPAFAQQLLSSSSLRRKVMQAKWLEVELVEKELSAKFYGRPENVGFDGLMLLLDILSDLARAIDSVQPQRSMEYALRTRP